MVFCSISLTNNPTHLQNLLLVIVLDIEHSQHLEQFGQLGVVLNQLRIDVVILQVIVAGDESLE